MSRLGEFALILVVAAVLIDDHSRMLLAERPAGKSFSGLWEFPGGKVEPGETPEAALVRELHEELAITVEEGDLQPFTFVSHAYGGRHLLMPVYTCHRWHGEAQGMEGQALAWVAPDRLRHYPMPPADEPLVELLQRL